MKYDRKRSRLALLAALALMLTLTAGCAGDQTGGAPQPDNSAAVSGEASPAPSENIPEETPGTAEPEPEQVTPSGSEPEETAPVSAQPEPSPSAQPEEVQPTPSQPEEVKPAETTPAAPEETAPAAAPLEDGTYTAAVTLSGGSGKAKVASPAALRVENGAVWATITWSSSNYDYMKVNGEKYLPLSIEGGSVFEIPVAGFDCDLPVVADTTAMSTPHEIEYTLRFDSATLQSAP